MGQIPVSPTVGSRCPSSLCLDPICRSRGGSNVAVGDCSRALSRWLPVFPQAQDGVGEGVAFAIRIIPE